MTPLYDVIVLGLGAMGSATLYQLSELKKQKRQDISILGIDQYAPPHEQGSSHGETRITRQSNFRSEKYIKLAQRSAQLFGEIGQKASPKFGDLYVKTGGLLLDSTETQECFSKIKKSCETYHISYRSLATKEISRSYPQFKLPPSTHGIFEENMGYLRPEKCIEAQLNFAVENGACIETNVKITHFEQKNDGLIEIASENGQKYLTNKLIICAGPWVNTFIPSTDKHKIKIYRQVLYWFEVEKKSLEHFQPDRFPVYVWYLEKENVVYGFPIIGNETCVKIAAEETLHYEAPYQPITPETVNRQVSTAEQEHMFQTFVKPYFRGITSRCLKARTCLYSVAPNWDFIIDFLPGFDKRVVVACPCSGHGFKYSAAIGEGLAEYVLKGKNDLMKAFAYQ